MPRWSLTTNERFFQNIDKQDNGCWIWIGCRAKSTEKMIYGRFYMNGKTYYAHRVSWILHNGKIPDKLQINHECDVPLCVNPEHLYPGTQKENVRDCIERGRCGDKRCFGSKNGRSKLNCEIAENITV